MHFAQAAQYITIVQDLGVPAPGAAQRQHLPKPAWQGWQLNLGGISGKNNPY